MINSGCIEISISFFENLIVDESLGNGWGSLGNGWVKGNGVWVEVEGEGTCVMVYSFRFFRCQILNY